MWDRITYPFPNLNGAVVEVWELISNLVSHFAGVWLSIHAKIKDKPRL